MTLNLGYAVSTLIFVVFFAMTLVGQLKTHRYHPVLYWLVVVATTPVGTTTSDCLERTLDSGTSNRRSCCSAPSSLCC